MHFLKKLLLIISLLYLSNLSAHAEQNVKFADIDLIVQNSKIGK